MRRGLMGWNADELPLATLAQRLDRVRAAMQRGGLDALLVYTNLVRPSAVSYLTGFTPYWSEGLLLVGRAGVPVFATALSKRVAEWIRSVSPTAEITNTPRPGTLFGQRLAADSSVQRVGILELDALPSGAYDDIVAAAPDLALVDATKLFAEARRGADAAELGLIARADAIAVAALNQVDGTDAQDAGSLAGLVEKHARLAGAEEVYIAIAADLEADRRMIRASPALRLGNLFALRASIAYKGQWVRRTRTFATDERSRQIVAHSDDWFAALVRAIEPGKPLGAQIAAQTKRLNGAALSSWMAETCRGSYPLQVVASSHAGDETPKDGDFLVLTLALSIDGTPWLGAAPLIIEQWVP